MTIRGLTLILLAAACGGKSPSVPEAGGPPDRDSWWTAATTRRDGGEKPLAPRELRALLEEGKRLGFDSDATWWAERSRFALDRILELDPSDADANVGAGRKTLQELPEFASLWEEMLGCRVPIDAIDSLLADYDSRVQSGERIFLSDAEWNDAGARLKEARDHLRRLESDAAYAGMQVALGRIRGTPLGQYPHVQVQAGPFLLFYAARDLERIPTEKPEDEEARLAGRRDVYRKLLEEKRPLLEALLRDMGELFPELAKGRPLSEREPLVQWTFAERSLYSDYLEKTHPTVEGDDRRPGHLDPIGRAILFEPPPPEPAAAPGGAPAPPEQAEERPDDPLGEAMAFFAAGQVLRRWAGVRRESLGNPFAESRALWLREGLPAWLAARRVKVPVGGGAVRHAHRLKFRLPPILRVVERESWLDLARYDEPIERDAEEEQRPHLPVASAFPDLALCLVDALLSGEKRDAFGRFLTGMLDGGMKTFGDFEECFGIEGAAGWDRLDAEIEKRLAASAPAK